MNLHEKWLMLRNSREERKSADETEKVRDYVFILRVSWILASTLSPSFRSAFIFGITRVTLLLLRCGFVGICTSFFRGLLLFLWKHNMLLQTTAEKKIILTKIEKLNYQIQKFQTFLFSLLRRQNWLILHPKIRKHIYHNSKQNERKNVLRVDQIFYRGKEYPDSN